MADGVPRPMSPDETDDDPESEVPCSPPAAIPKDPDPTVEEEITTSAGCARLDWAPSSSVADLLLTSATGADCGDTVVTSAGVAVITEPHSGR